MKSRQFPFNPDIFSSFISSSSPPHQQMQIRQLSTDRELVLIDPQKNFYPARAKLIIISSRRQKNTPKAAGNLFLELLKWKTPANGGQVVRDRAKVSWCWTVGYFVQTKQETAKLSIEFHLICYNMGHKVLPLINITFELFFQVLWHRAEVLERIFEFWMERKKSMFEKECNKSKNVLLAL